MAREVRRVLFLAAESAAGLGLNHPHAVGRQLQRDRERTMHVVRTLQRPVHGHPALVRHGDDAIGLDVQLLLMPGSILALDDDGGVGQASLDRALGDRDRLERTIRTLGIEDRGLRRVINLDAGAADAFGVGVRKEQNRLGEVIDLVLGQARLILVDQRDDVLAGDVAVVDDGESGLVEIETNGVERSARDRGANRPAVKHARKRQIVDIPGGAGDLGVCVLAADIAADGGHLVNLAPRNLGT